MSGDREEIRWRGELLALVSRAAPDPASTGFLTPPEAPIQVGLAAGPRRVERHEHRPVERRLSTTAELVVVRAGACEVDVYSPLRELLATRALGVGDAILLLAGGHAFRLDAAARLLVVKQGPYAVGDDKAWF